MKNDKWLASGHALNALFQVATLLYRLCVFIGKELHVVTFPNCWKDTKALKKD